MSNYMRKIQPSEHGKIAKLYKSMSARELGTKYGVSPQAILNILRKMDIEPRKQYERPNAR